MANIKINIFQIVTLLAFMQTIIYAIDVNSEPQWNLVEEQGLFQSEDNLVSGNFQQKTKIDPLSYALKIYF